MLAGLIVLSGCNQTLVDTSESSFSATSISMAPKSVPTPIKYCEFTLGEPIPEGKSFASKEVVPTEGDERIFYIYKACGGSQQIKVELTENVINSIEVTGIGNCIEPLACVGETYKEVFDKNPSSKMFLSQVEGATFSLLIGNNVIAKFDPNSIPKFCYDSPTTCNNTMNQSKVISLILYRSPN